MPPDLFATLAPKVVQAYRNRAAVEAPYELRRHPEPLRLTLLAAFCHLHCRELTDTLVDLLLDLIHRIGAKAERKVEKALLDDFKRVRAKTGMLYRVAEAALAQPTGVVQEVVFPVVSEATLRDRTCCDEPLPTREYSYRDAHRPSCSDPRVETSLSTAPSRRVPSESLGEMSWAVQTLLAAQAMTIRWPRQWCPTPYPAFTPGSSTRPCRRGHIDACPALHGCAAGEAAYQGLDHSLVSPGAIKNQRSQSCAMPAWLSDPFPSRHGDLILKFLQGRTDTSLRRRGAAYDGEKVLY